MPTAPANAEAEAEAERRGRDRHAEQRVHTRMVCSPTSPGASQNAPA
jgi:hypothetical protein